MAWPVSMTAGARAPPVPLPGSLAGALPALGDSLITVSSNAATLGYGLRYKTASKSSNFTFGVSDYTILCTAGSGGIAGTLPAASGLTGQKYYLYKVDSAAGACTLAPNG